MKLEGPLRLVRRGGPRIREIRDDLECLRLVRHETLEDLLGDLKRVAVGHVPQPHERAEAQRVIAYAGGRADGFGRGRQPRERGGEEHRVAGPVGQKPAAERTDARPVKRVVLVRLFYGGETARFVSPYPQEPYRPVPVKAAAKASASSAE